MLSLRINRITVLLTCSLGALFLLACGDDETEPKSFLNSYRILALRAEPAQLTVTSQSQLSLYDFHPQDLKGDRPKIEYAWRICPLSLGSLTRYECLVDEIPLAEDDPNSDSTEDDTEAEESIETEEDNSNSIIGTVPVSSSITLNPFELFEAFGDDLQSQMEQFEMGAGMLGSEMNFFESGIFEVYVKLTVKIEGEADFEAVKTMTVLFDSEIPINQHPSIMEISSSIDLANSPTLKPEEEFDIEIEASPDSVEEYTAVSSASDQEQGFEERTTSETPFVYYYTTSGRFDSAVKLIEDSQSTLTLGEETGPQKLFIVLRDGRGGVDLRAFDFEVEE